MGLGTQILDNLEYAESSLLTPKQARAKRIAKLSLTRKARRDATRYLPAEIADELAEPSDAGYGLGTLHQLEDEPVIVDSPDAGTIAWVDDAGLYADWTYDFGGADPSGMTDDEADAWWAPAGLDDLAAVDEAGAGGIFTDELYGDTLELASNAEEFVANDGFVITRGDFYRRWETGRP